MTNAVSGTSGSSGAYESGTTTQPPQTAAVNKEMFLQLLVAQIKNQDPLNPADGVQFLTQLSQFSELEQMMEVRSELTQIRQHVEQFQPPQATEKTGASDNV